MSLRDRGRERAAGAAGRLALLAASTVLATGMPVAAEEPVIQPQATHNLFGMTGLIDMPSAEMQPDGQVTVTAGYHGDGYLRNTISAQIFPGVEGAFRYSVLDDFFGPATDPGTLYDRSFDIKLRLIEESSRWPAVSVGLQDFLGTGIYSGEYVALTKNFLDGDLAVTGGIGWGRFAGRGTVTNPLCEFANRLCERSGGESTGGTVNYGQFFQGEDLGFFGGLQYDTPLEGLTLKAEYSSDTYDAESSFIEEDQPLPFNFGAEYRPYDGVEVGAYYLYGNQFGLRLSLTGNPLKPIYKDDGEPAPLPLTPRPLPENAAAVNLLGDVRTRIDDGPVLTRFAEAGVASVRVEERDNGLRWATATLPPSADYVCPDDAAAVIDAEYGVIDAVTFVHADGTIVCSVALRPAADEAIARAIKLNVDYPTGWYDNADARAQIVAALEEALEPDRIGLFGLELGPRQVEIYVENDKFAEWPRAIGRVARALARNLPPSVEIFKIVTVEHNLPVAAVFLERSALEAAVDRPDAARRAWLSARVEDAEKPDWSEVEGTLEQFPKYDWAISPALPISLFDPDDPFRFDVAVDASARVELLPGLSATGTVRKRVFGQLDDITRESNSVLPRVRSDFKNYLEEGDPGIRRLTADYLTKFDEDVYGRVSVGLLESMHAGVSTEVLWKPVEQSWGLGLELNWSKQRDFDQLFSFRDHEVFTGHASLYWDTGIYDTYAQVDVGRYLARDWGGTFTLTRRFANGWELGGFFTLTNVPFDEFGEGSFDKGIIFRVPFNWFLPIESQRELSYTIRPLTRDGGQRLRVQNRLYQIVDDHDRQQLRDDWGSFWE